jgi:hypothetical protein
MQWADKLERTPPPYQSSWPSEMADEDCGLLIVGGVSTSPFPAILSCTCTAKFIRALPPAGAIAPNETQACALVR